MYTHDPSRKRSLPAVLFLLAPAIACSGSSDFTASHAPDASTDEDAGDNTNIVANPNGDAREAGTSPARVDATAGLPIVDASGPDAGVSDASGPDALVCPSMELACDGGCLTNDLLNCGGCGKACAMPANGTATCSVSDAGFACGVSCSANFTHCAASCVDVQTDPRNCGSCAHDCLGGTCSAGKCQPWMVTQTTNNVLFQDVPNVPRAKMVTDGKNIAWIDTVAGVLEVPITGGNQMALVPVTSLPKGFAIRSLAMAGGVIAWTMADPTNGISIWTTPEGVSNPIVTSFTVLGAAVGDIPRGLALDATGKTAFFIDDPAMGTAASVYECDLAVGKSCVSIQATTVSEGINAANDILVLGNTLFWTDSANGNIFRAELSPSSGPTAIATGQDTPHLLAADSTDLYWANATIDREGGSSDLFAVSRVSRTNWMNVTQVLQDQPGDLSAIAVDGVNLYFAGQLGGSGGFSYEPVTGVGQSMPLPGNSGYGALGVAAAGGAVYWLTVEPPNYAYQIYGMRFP